MGNLHMMRVLSGNYDMHSTEKIQITAQDLGFGTEQTRAAALSLHR